MSEPSRALERLVANENSLSDLLAFLFERDPQPLIGLLGLPADTYRCRREVKVQGAGRMDLVLCRQSDDRPVAVLEMKGASDEHSDQLDRYQAWAATCDQAPALFYCTFDGVPRPPWRSLSLSAIFCAWRTVAEPHTAWLAGEITAILHRWDAEADAVIGRAQGWYVPDLVTRRTARAVDEVLCRASAGAGLARATVTKAGNPTLLAWRHHPYGSDRAWVGVDVRCRGRGAVASPWLFRPCVDVDVRDDSKEAVREAALEAHDLAAAMHPAMVLSAVQQAVAERGRPELGRSLSVARHDGLAGPPDRAVLADWRRQIVAGSGPPGRHPVFRHDKGRRLATQFDLDVAQVTRADLADLTLMVVNHLVERAEGLSARS